MKNEYDKTDAAKPRGNCTYLPDPTLLISRVQGKLILRAIGRCMLWLTTTSIGGYCGQQNKQ